ncbi:MAG: hypothetical protein QM597_08345 [Aeromicrobium sp.]|uniref:hypothetical protein n=1 Tax=Aeromicrobium sp. TaxID=1871063 RepID=UPI0039E6F5BA
MIRGLWALAGLVVGVLGALVHHHGHAWPWGLPVALAPLGPLALLADRTVSLGSAALLVGWGLVLMLQGSMSPGDYLIADDGIGWAFTLLGLGCLIGVMLGNSRLKR